jgi:hypothetical protein
MSFAKSIAGLRPYERTHQATTATYHARKVSWKIFQDFSDKPYGLTPNSINGDRSMTIVIPKPNFIDKLLKFIGKMRGVMVRGETGDPNSTQTYYAPRKESILRALLRPRWKALPEGMIDIFSLDVRNEVSPKETSTFKPFALIGLLSQELIDPVRKR